METTKTVAPQQQPLFGNLVVTLARPAKYRPPKERLKIKCPRLPRPKLRGKPRTIPILLGKSTISSRRTWATSVRHDISCFLVRGTYLNCNDIYLMLSVVILPVQVCLCMIFLQKLLGWRFVPYLTLCLLAMTYSTFSAYVGLASTVALLPVPGYIAKLVQDVQRTRMKKVWYLKLLSLLYAQLKLPSFRLMHGFKMWPRVISNESLTRMQTYLSFLAASVLRMIKLFGWEGRMSKRIEDKRLEELKWIWKLRVIPKSSPLRSDEN